MRFELSVKCLQEAMNVLSKVIMEKKGSAKAEARILFEKKGEFLTLGASNENEYLTYRVFTKSHDGQDKSFACFYKEMQDVIKSCSAKTIITFFHNGKGNVILSNMFFL